MRGTSYASRDARCVSCGPKLLPLMIGSSQQKGNLYINSPPPSKPSQLYGFCFNILVYLGPNPWLGCIFSDLSLLVPSMSSLAYLFSLEGPSTCIEKPFLAGAVVGLCWTCPKHLREVFIYTTPIYS